MVSPKPNAVLYSPEPQQKGVGMALDTNALRQVIEGVFHGWVIEWTSESSLSGKIYRIGENGKEWPRNFDLGAKQQWDEKIDALPAMQSINQEILSYDVAANHSIQSKLPTLTEMRKALNI